MTPNAELTAKPLRTENGRVISSAELRCGDEVRDLWFSVPEEHQDILVSHHDHLVQASLLWAQSRSDRFIVNGTVTESLTQSLEEYGVIWNRWRPEDYRAVQIETDSKVVDSPIKNGHAIAFSGGVDACATLSRHAHGGIGHRQRKPLRAAVVHGFDIPLEERIAYDKAFESASRITRDVDVPLLDIATNARELPVPWGDSFATFITAALRFIGNGCTGGVMASCSTYMKPVFPWASNSISNYFLGSQGFPLYTDGADLTRLEKVRLLANWPAAVRDVRVCWEGNEPGRNCGRCEKCLRTQLEFLAVGIEDFDAFVSKPSRGAFKQIVTRNIFQLRYLEEVLDHCESKDCSEWWTDELRSSLLRIRRQERLKSIPFLRKTVRAVKQYFPSGTTAGAKP